MQINSLGEPPRALVTALLPKEESTPPRADALCCSHPVCLPACLGLGLPYLEAQVREELDEQVG